ncbi:hypothetical protein [Roseomonas sp. 18066]|uniref:hypothetical protein n=1 Tax=Roseomonas sp. 18066 TaxID=2681412 RepID=UPI001357E740|nr:hypothetical protein [Roseomonas sp. 18066]
MLPIHRFAIGQKISLMPGRYDSPAPQGDYTITRLLPNDSTDREYRVKNSRDGHERVVRESQLRNMSAL